MMTKNFTFIFFISFISLFGRAQDKKSLEERTLKIYTLYAQEKFDSVVDYMQLENFISISKRDYIKELKNNSSEEITVSPVHTPPNFYFGEIKKVGDNYYCIYYYDQTLKTKFHEEVSKQNSEYLIAFAKKRFKVDKVVFNERMNAIFLLNRIRAIAIAEKRNNYIWTFEPIIKDRAVREQLGL